MTLNELKLALGVKRILCIDYETFWAQYYTLSKLSTTAYVRHPEFHAHGVGVQYDDDSAAEWISHNEIPKFFSTVDWENVALLAHHCQFDGFITTHHYKKKPKVYLDTLSMARPLVGSDIGNGLNEVAKYYGFAGKVNKGSLLDTKDVRHLSSEMEHNLGIYCCDDVQDTLGIFKQMITDDEFPLDELRLIDLTIRMYTEPVLQIDQDLAKEALEDAKRNKRHSILTAAQSLGLARYLKTKGEDYVYEIARKELSSTKLFAENLEFLGVDVPKKEGKPHPNGSIRIIPAVSKTDRAFLALQEHKDPAVRTLVAGRLAAATSIEETRPATVLRHAVPAFPVYLKMYGAHTLRWSGGDKVNLQNFVSGSKLRRSIRAPKGYKIIVVDSSQIEARTNAELAHDEDALEVFRLSDAGKGPDPYCVMATDIYNRQITKKNKQERQVGKAAELGFGFGMGGPKFAHRLAIDKYNPIIISDSEGERIKGLWRAKHKPIVQFWKFLDRMLNTVMLHGGVHEYGPLVFWGDPDNNIAGVDMPNGLSLTYPGLRKIINEDTDSRELTFIRDKQGNRSKIYGGLFCENIVQSTARIIVGEQILEIAERYRVVFAVHDEVVFLAPTRQAEKAYEFGIQCLRTPPTWLSNIPLNAEGGIDDCYSK